MKSYYLTKAEENLPKLIKTIIAPKIGAVVLDNRDTFTIDLGNHYVGYFFFKMWFLSTYIDAPVRMNVRFFETERELNDDYDDYKGELCKSWLQEEIINVDFPGKYKMPRRYATRFIKITVLNTPKKVVLSDFGFESQTSADLRSLKPCQTCDNELAKIDKIAVNTLKNCMQRVFEDGPKRDRRLWIGDLRLEALANYYTFENISLVKRCLYLFAAAERNEYGILPGYVYENPIYCSGNWFLIDYSLMFVCTLCDLYSHTGDAKIFHDLYPIAKSILDVLDETKDDEGLVTTRSGDVFIDWCKGLIKNTALEGIYLYTLDRWCEVLESIGNEDDATLYRARLEQGRAASRKYLYDENNGAFINKRDKYQNSVHTATWMILGGVVKGEEAKRILKEVISSPDSVKPFTPYMHHYTVDALIKAGLMQEAEKYIRNIWGGMVKMGADTFFEVYVPSNPEFSPYGDRKVNSMCHAWSCTATYFIRKYGFGTVPQLSRKIDVHKMRLNSAPFQMIKSGVKTIELRLFDEKRQQIKTGDKIVFTNNANGETLNTTVVKLHRFDSFKELYKSLPLLKCGYTTENVDGAKPSDMEQYYSVEEQKKHGVVGIELCRPNQITDESVVCLTRK